MRLDGWISTPLADMDVFRGMGSAFRSKRATVDPETVGLIVGTVIAVIFATWALAKIVKYVEHRRRRTSPWGLFAELCQAHNLDRGARRLLRQLAVRGGAPHPAALFIDPQHWEGNAIPDELAHERAELANIAARLFGAPAASEAANTEAPAVDAIAAEETESQEAAAASV